MIWHENLNATNERHAHSCFFFLFAARRIPLLLGLAGILNTCAATNSPTTWRDRGCCPTADFFYRRYYRSYAIFISWRIHWGHLGEWWFSAIRNNIQWTLALSRARFWNSVNMSQSYIGLLITHYEYWSAEGIEWKRYRRCEEISVPQFEVISIVYRL